MIRRCVEQRPHFSDSLVYLVSNVCLIAARHATVFASWPCCWECYAIFPSVQGSMYTSIPMQYRWIWNQQTMYGRKMCVFNLHHSAIHLHRALLAIKNSLTSVPTPDSERSSRMICQILYSTFLQGCRVWTMLIGQAYRCIASTWLDSIRSTAHGWNKTPNLST